MKPYGDKPKEGEYYEWFEKIETREPALDDVQESSSSHSVRPKGTQGTDALRPKVKIEFGVNEIRVTGGGKQSRSFNDGANGKKDAGVGTTGEDCFHFSPTEDSPNMKIKVQVHHPHQIQSAQLEMFCRDHEDPIWTRCWGNLWKPTIPGDTNRAIDEIIPRGKNDGTADFEIEWKEIELPKDLVIPGGLDKPSFTDGVPVVPHSPYRLKFSVSARASSSAPASDDKYGFPQIAWTHAHVLVKEIKLAWGKDEMIPTKRTDFKYHGVQRAKVASKNAGFEQLKRNKDSQIAELKEKDQITIEQKNLSLETTTNEKRIATLKEEIEAIQKKTEQDYEEEFDKIVSREKEFLERDQESLRKTETSRENQENEVRLNDELLKRQKKLLGKIAEKTLSPGQGNPKDKIIEVNLNVPKFNETSGDAEFFYFQEMWGKGPLIPIVLTAKIKTISGDAVIDQKGLGRAQFIWDWQDNENEDIDAHLDKWMTISSGVTKYFIKKVFNDNRDKAKFPFHGFNCPAKYGGRSGEKRPAPKGGDTLVFPSSAPHFSSFPVTVTNEFKKRDWASLSYADPESELKDRDDNPGSSAVLFHCSNVAGDRFRISSALVTEKLSEFDKDLESDAYYDLPKDAGEKKVPWATTYYFEVWRHIKASWFHTPSFNAENDQVVDYVEKQMEREIGFKMKIEKKAFPDLRQYYVRNIDKIIRDDHPVPPPPDKLDGKGNINSVALFLRKSVSAPADTKDYAFDSLVDFKTVSDHYKTGKWFLIKDISSAQGREIKGSQSGNKAVVARKPISGDESLYPAVMVVGDTLNAGEDFDCGEGNSLSNVKGKIGDFYSPAVTLWSGYGISVTLNSKTFMSSRNVEITAPGVQKVTLKYSEGKIATRKLSNQRITQLEQFCGLLNNQPTDKPIAIKITGHGDKRGIERMGYVKKWLETNILDTKEIMCSDLTANFAKKLIPKDIRDKKIQEWDTDELNKVFINYQTEEIKWRKIFNKVLKEAVLPNYDDWKEEGRALFVCLRGRNQFDKRYTNGAIESDWCDERFGMAGVFRPAITKDDKVEKRWLKSTEIVAAHEFGHLFMLPHSPPRVLDSKEAVGNWIEHLAHDSCLMNYDPDTAALCGWCMLRKRGWQVTKVVSDGRYIPHDPAWVEESRKQMEADATKGPANQVRYAMFLLDINYYLGTKGRRIEEARRHMKAARAMVPVNKDDEKHIFLLRCEIVFYLKINELEKANELLEELKKCTTFSLDIGDWKYSDAEKRLITDGNTGQHWKMEQSDKDVSTWHLK